MPDPGIDRATFDRMCDEAFEHSMYITEIFARGESPAEAQRLLKESREEYQHIRDVLHSMGNTEN
jgi:hypothetical protein